MTNAPNVGLFATCLVDLYRPSVGFAAADLLERAGCRVCVPVSQTCCGQPAYNAGDQKSAADIARNVVDTFEGFDYVATPSGSCAGMLRCHYPNLLKDDAQYGPRAATLAEKCWELVSFLTDILGWTDIDANWKGKIAYHDSCSSLRELGVKEQPRALLSKVRGLTMTELDAPEVCCGFGGTFCVKYAEVSGAMVDRKVDDIMDTGAKTVLGGDLGCLMNIAGCLARRGEAVEARHIAEVLAEHTDAQPIGGDKA